MAPDGTIIMGVPAASISDDQKQQTEFYDQTAITAMPVRQQTNTDRDLNEREEFTAEEVMLRQDGTFGVGGHQTTGQSQQIMDHHHHQ